MGERRTILIDSPDLCRIIGRRKKMGFQKSLFLSLLTCKTWTQEGFFGFFQRRIAARHWNKIEFLSGKRRVFMYSDEKTLDIVSLPCKKTKYECKGCFQPLWMLLQEKSRYSCSSFVMVWELEKNGKISCHEKINTVLSARDFRHDFNLLLVKSVFGWDLLVGCKMVTLSSLTATKSRSSREDIGGRYTTTKKVLWHNLTKKSKRKLIENCATHDSWCWIAGKWLLTSCRKALS